MWMYVIESVHRCIDRIFQLQGVHHAFLTGCVTNNTAGHFSPREQKKKCLLNTLTWGDDEAKFNADVLWISRTVIFKYIIEYILNCNTRYQNYCTFMLYMGLVVYSLDPWN